MWDFSLINLIFAALVLVVIPLGAHEAGHWAMLRKYNTPIKEFWIGLGPSILHLGRVRIGLFPLGAAVVPDHTKFEELTPTQKIYVALAGPVFSFFTAALFYTAPLYWPQYTNFGLLKLVGDFNLFIGAFNLIPFPPLDGFQVFVNWHERRENKLHPDKIRIAYRIGNGILYGVGFVVIFNLIWATK